MHEVSRDIGIGVEGVCFNEGMERAILFSNVFSLHSLTCPSRCSRLSRETWKEQQTLQLSFFPFVVQNAVYYISDYQARDLYGKHPSHPILRKLVLSTQLYPIPTRPTPPAASGRVCGGVYKWSCYQSLPDGLYILRLGIGPLGFDIGYPYGTAAWKGCGESGGFFDQLSKCSTSFSHT